MSYSGKDSELQSVIASIADQLCDTVDNKFDMHVSIDSDDVQGQKLSLLVNFLLENVRRNMSQLEQLNNRLEHKVKERTELLDLVISGSDDGVWIWFFNEDRVEFSAKWHAMVGEPVTDELQDLNHWLQRVHPRDRADLQGAIKALLEGRENNLTAEYRIRHASGGYRWMLCRGACQRDENGEPTLLAGTQTDITSMRLVDQRTGLPNEHFLRERMEDVMDKGASFYLILIAFHQLDSLSESLDHSGLSTLQDDVSRRLIGTVDVRSVVAKISGNTFAVFGQVRGNDDPTRLMEAECDAIATSFSEPFRIQSYGDHVINTAIGALESTELANTSAEEMINAAWSALRYSKKRGEICFYDQQHRDVSARRVLIEQKIRSGIRDGGIAPWFQPIFAGRTKALVGFEALARMDCPGVGTVSPAEFIPAAEQSGLMGELGECILSQSIAMAKSLTAGVLRGEPFYIGVNVSAMQLLSEGFASTVFRLLNEHQLSPEFLRLEVTESVFVGNIDIAKTELSKLRNAGIKIALDDFGTGYSSLSYLRHLPIDVLKIDRSFITDLEQQDSKAAIVETIVSLARLLELDVVAEGVETEAELTALNAISAMSIQGFYFSRALPEYELGPLIEHNLNSRRVVNLPARV